MKKINKLQPEIMVGMEFNIPMFAADNQMFRCLGINQLHQNIWKEYEMVFRYIPMSYSVPENIKIIIRFKGEIAIELYEIKAHKDVFLMHSVVDTNHINTLKGLKQTFYNLGIKAS